MTSANINAHTGLLIAQVWYSEALSLPFSNYTYSGSTTGAYVGELDLVDGIASQMIGMSTRDFRALSSGLRSQYRTMVRDLHGMGTGTNFTFDPWVPYVRGSTFASRQEAGRKDNDLSSFNADLIVGFIPEGTDNTRVNKCVTQLGKSRTWVIEHAKAVRRERDIGINGVFDKMYQQSKNGKTPAQVVRWLIRYA